MLATKPQSIKHILSSSIKTYKKIFIPMLPISLMWSVIHVTERVVEKVGDLWANLAALVLGVAVLGCFSWGVMFVYSYIINGKTDLKDTLIITLKQFLRIIGLVAIISGGVLMIAAIVGLFINLLKISETQVTYIYIAMLPIAFLFVCFLGIGILEILIKKQLVFHAIKRAIKIFFTRENIWRALSFVMLIVIMGIITFLPAIILVILFSSLAAKFSWMSTNLQFGVGLFFAFLTSIFIWLPLFIVTIVNMYNDLVLRFERKHT